MITDTKKVLMNSLKMYLIKCKKVKRTYIVKEHIFDDDTLVLSIIWDVCGTNNGATFFKKV